MTSTVTPHHEPAPAAEPASSSFTRASMSSDDLDDARRRLEAALEGRDFRARPGATPFAFRFASAGDSRLTVQTGTFLGHLQGTIPWTRDYVISWFQQGSVTIDYPTGQLTSVGTRPLLTPTETSFSFSMTPHRHGIVHVDGDFLEHIATERHHGPAQRIVFDYTAVPSDDALDAWRRTLSRATPVIVSDRTAPLVRLEAQTALTRALLDLFPWHAVDVPDTLRTERTTRLRLAAEFVHAHADQVISSADIATAAGMHTRTLQQLMNQHLGTSPSTYLRHVRLDRARQDLLAADPRTTLVSDVARRWGFGNLGRFSAAYRARFGEFPRNTLAR